MEKLCEMCIKIVCVEICWIQFLVDFLLVSLLKNPQGCSTFVRFDHEAFAAFQSEGEQLCFLKD